MIKGEIRCVRAGITFRLYGSRVAAIYAANNLTRSFGKQHRAKAVRGTGGFIAMSADGTTMHDSAGLIPQDGMKLFRNRGAFVEFIE